MIWQQPKYDIKLKILNSDDDYDNYEEEDLEYCPFCGVKLNSSYTVYLKKEKIKTTSCYMCKIINNNSKSYIQELIVCKTKLSQLDIIRKTFEFYKNNNRIPYITEIDENAKLVPINAFVFAQIIKKKKYNKKLKGLCLFFTGNIIESLLRNKSYSMFGGSRPQILKYDSDFFDIEKYELTKKEQKIINKYNKKIEKEKKYTLNNIRKNIDKQIKLKEDYLNNINLVKNIFMLN